jgi:hypothetical protein
MLFEIASQQATALPSTATSWQYHPARITLTLRFLTFSRFASSIDPVPISVETPTVLQCSFPPAAPDSVPDTIRSPNFTTFVDYVTTLLLDLLVTLRYYSIVSILLQRNATGLFVSDGGHKRDYGFFGGVIGTEDEVLWDCQGIV